MEVSQRSQCKCAKNVDWKSIPSSHQEMEFVLNFGSEILN